MQSTAENERVSDPLTGARAICLRCRQQLVWRAGRATCPSSSEPGRCCQIDRHQALAELATAIARSIHARGEGISR